MVVVKRKTPGMIRNCAEIVRDLPVVLTDIFEARQFERTDRHGYELDSAYSLLDFSIANRNSLAGNDAIVETS